jgi:hypothetical protein
MRVFFSWQSDTPNNIGRTFVRRALDEAARAVSEELALEEAERVAVDQDTQGRLGSPLIAETILEKIREADVVVSDVTLVGTTDFEEEKRLINANVAYELGYAHSEHGDRAMLKIMNAHYGPADDLPFDLRHRRWPVAYELAPTATPEERGEARRELVGELTPILRAYAQEAGSERREIGRPGAAMAYWESEEILARKQAIRDEPAYEFRVPTETPYIAVHVQPTVQLDQLPIGEFNAIEIFNLGTALDRSNGMDTDRNRYGRIVYTHEGADLYAWTQITRDRTIWGVNLEFMRIDRERSNYYLPMPALETALMNGLRRYIRFAFDSLGYPTSAMVTLGLCNPDEHYILSPNRIIGHDMDGPIYENVIVRGTMNQESFDTEANNLIVNFTEGVYEAAMLVRPELPDLRSRIEAQDD